MYFRLIDSLTKTEKKSLVLELFPSFMLSCEIVMFLLSNSTCPRLPAYSTINLTFLPHNS